MVNVVSFKPFERKSPIKPEKQLLSAINDLLQSNERAARAVGELPARFVAIDECIAEVAMPSNCRPYIDAVVEQDRMRLLAAMQEVLQATLEYAKAIEARFRSVPQTLPDFRSAQPGTGGSLAAI